MKPPYLKKLSKKQLRKEYTRQWREAIRANGEIYKANQINDQLNEFIRTQAEEIEVKSIALTEHFWVIEWYKKKISQISNWVVTDMWYKEWELILINQSFNDQRNKDFEALERENYRLKNAGKHDDLTQAIHFAFDDMICKNIFKDPKDIEIENLKQLLAHEQKKRTEAELLNVDLEEALSRSRQLRKSLQEVVDRKTWEKAKIEDMARNLYEVIRAEVEPVAKEVFWEGCYKDRDWSKLSEEEKDRFRVHATYIISHQPTDGKPEGTTLDEGSAG